MLNDVTPTKIIIGENMVKGSYTAYQVVQIKASFTYFLFVFLYTLVAVSFLIAARISISEILPPLVIMGIASLLAYIHFRRKKSGKEFICTPLDSGFHYYFRSDDSKIQIRHKSTGHLHLNPIILPWLLYLQ